MELLGRLLVPLQQLVQQVLQDQQGLLEQLVQLDLQVLVQLAPQVQLDHLVQQAQQDQLVTQLVILHLDRLLR
jgi:hypothetical protein